MNATLTVSSGARVTLNVGGGAGPPASPSNPPLVFSVAPPSGPVAGGTNVTITGQGFTGATGATFNGIAATNLLVVSDTQITCTTPAQMSGGAVAVAVTTPAGTGTLFGGFTYSVLAPTLASALNAINTNVGDIDGGYTVTLTGTHFTNASSVAFGGTLASNLLVVNDTTITCTVPAHASGLVDVIVTNPGGSNPGGNNAWEYFSPAQLSLTGWWRSYAGMPWVGTASAGSSSGRQLTSSTGFGGTDPSVVGLNGHGVASFNGASDYMRSAIAPATLFASNALTIIALFRPAAAHMDDGSTNGWYQQPALLSTFTNQLVGLQYSSQGAVFGTVDHVGGVFYRTNVPASLDAYHLAAFTLDATPQQRGRVDGGGYQATAADAWEVVADIMSSGLDSVTHTNYYQGTLAELITANTVISDANKDKIRGYEATRYGVTV